MTTNSTKNQLLLAQSLTSLVNQSRESGEMLEQVTPTTKDLLNFWFNPDYCASRQINFHEGQKQAILNTIYASEILKTQDVGDLYDKISSTLRFESGIGLESLQKSRYNFPRYCMKMATGTGKTRVLEALVIWQYLNAKAKNPGFSKNFLVVAPGLIVYDRLKDAFIGKVNEETGERIFEKSDFKIFEELFIPETSREEMFSFLQSSIVTKDNIGKKITGDGQIIITNWHIFLDKKNKNRKSRGFGPTCMTRSKW